LSDAVPMLKLGETYGLSDEQIGNLTLTQLAGLMQTLAKFKGGGDKDPARQRKVKTQADFQALARKFKG